MDRSDATVMTVLGAVHPSDLGVTLPHEHLLIDLRCLWHEPHYPWQEPLVDGDVTLERRGDLSLDPYVSRQNLVLDDSDLAVREIEVFRQAGGQTIVDLTVDGIGPRPEALRDISVRTGVNIVAGCGFYVQAAHSEWVAGATEDELLDRILDDIHNGFGVSGVRPGIIGEIGTSSPVHHQEENVLRASARAQVQTGLALNVHVAIFGRTAVDVLQILEKAGANLSRVVVSHMDELLDLAYHRTVLERGASIEFDTFGSEFTFLGTGRREPGDRQRIDLLLRLLHDGWEDRILLSQDVCTKIHLRAYGGHGYAHLLRAIVPQLRQRGLDEDMLQRLLVRNPTRILVSK